jgi:hypothetical protein
MAAPLSRRAAQSFAFDHSKQSKPQAHHASAMHRHAMS